MKSDTFKIFLDKVLTFPLWVKQIIYLHLHEDLSNIFENQPINTNADELFQEFIPIITHIGKKELSERNHMHEEVMYTFLKSVMDKKNVIEIALDCFMTLEEVAKLYLQALKNEYVMPANSKTIQGLAEFYSGQIKTGEFLYRIGRITVDQLDVAIRQLTKLKNQGQNIHMAELLEGLGYIQREELDSVMIMKEESKRRFIFNMKEINAGENNVNSDVIQLRQIIQNLSYENNYLKAKLKEYIKPKN